jgi:hypothetical protein
MGGKEVGPDVKTTCKTVQSVKCNYVIMTNTYTSLVAAMLDEDGHYVYAISM